MTDLMDVRDDDRIERALAPLGTLDLGPERPRPALDAGRLRARRWQRPRRLVPAVALVATIAAAVAVIAVNPTHPPSQPSASNARQFTTDRQLRSGLIGGWDAQPRDREKPNGSYISLYDDGTFYYNDGCAESTGHWTVKDARIRWSGVRENAKDCPTGLAGLGLVSTSAAVALANGTLTLGAGQNQRTFSEPKDLTAQYEALTGDWVPQAHAGERVPDRVHLALRPDETFVAFDGCREQRGTWVIDDAKGLFSFATPAGKEFTDANRVPVPAGCRPFPLDVYRVGVPFQVQGGQLAIGDREFTRTTLPEVGTDGWLPGFSRFTAATAITDAKLNAQLIDAVRTEPSYALRDQPFLAWPLAPVTLASGAQQAALVYLAGFGDRACLIEVSDPASGGDTQTGVSCPIRDPAPDPASPIGIDNIWVVPDATQAFTFTAKDGTDTRVAASGNVVTAVPGADLATVTYTNPAGDAVTVPFGS